MPDGPEDIYFVLRTPDVLLRCANTKTFFDKISSSTRFDASVLAIFGTHSRGVPSLLEILEEETERLSFVRAPPISD